MVKGILFLLLLGLAAPGVAGDESSEAANSPVVFSCGGKQISVTLGKMMRVIDLGREISGCTELYDPAEPSRRIQAAARIGIIDRALKNGKHYLVLWALANANCNVQGHCGAGEDCTLLWLQLDENLKLEKKQAVVVQECRAEIGIPDMDLEYPGECLRLLDSELDLKFGDLISETPAWTRLVYEHDACEKGLVVTAPMAGLQGSNQNEIRASRGRGTSLSHFPQYK